MCDWIDRLLGSESLGGVGHGVGQNVDRVSQLLEVLLIPIRNLEGARRVLLGVILSWISLTALTSSGSFIDEGLAAGTTYDYRVRAYTAAGTSSWSTTASGTTLTAPAIDLQATGYKVKGVQHVDLTWSDSGAGSYDIYRNDVMIDTVTWTSYTDNLGIKGGGSYSYRICEAGTMTCSNTAQVTF